MRLIDADKWSSELEAIIQDENADGNYKDYAMHLISEIDSQPTAYDADKVVEKLKEEMNDKLNAANGYEEVGDFEMAEIYSERANEYRNAIKIAKAGAGGVSDNY